MQKYLDMPIKKVIEDNPGIGDFLEECNIGCVPCSVGTCQPKDIFTIHNLHKKDEVQLMYKIEKEFYPDRDIKLKEVAGDEEEREKDLKYSPPIKQLVDEHIYIKQVLAYIPHIIELISKPEELDKELVLNTVRFIREYADKYHHAKEEDILFDYTDKSLEIINVILEDHKTARNHMKAVVEAVDREDMIWIIQKVIIK